MIQKNITILIPLLFSSGILFSMDDVIEIEKYLLQVCEVGDLGTVNHLLDHSLSMSLLIDAYDSGRSPTPMHIAAKHGHIAIIEALHHAGFSLDNQSSHKMTPLHVAVTYKHEKVIVKLIELGARFDLKDKGGETGLHYAVGMKENNITKTLVQNGAPLFSKNNAGETPLERCKGNAERRRIILHAMQREIDRARAEKRAIR